MAAKAPVATDATTSTKLALIYSRLAELEIQKEKETDMWDAITRKVTPESLDAAEISNIEDIFQDAVRGSRADSAPTVIDAEAVSRVRLLILAEQQFSESLRSSLAEKLTKLKAHKSERDASASEMFRIRQEMLSQDVSMHDLEELCRSLQKLCKEKDEQRGLLVGQEREKTLYLERECVQSIDAVTKKIAEEEAELDAKSAENEELKQKLEKFSQHLALRRERMRNEERARDLQARLDEARKAQIEYNKVQDKLRAESYKSKIRHLEEAIATLQQQVAMYGGKFDEFEDTLTRSCTILEKVEERERALEAMVDKLFKEYEALKASAAEADVGLIHAMESRRALNEAVAQSKQVSDKLERKCRKVLAKWQELIKTQPASSSSSSSSSSAAPPSPALVGVGSPEAADRPEESAIPTPISIALDRAPSTPARRNRTPPTVAPSSSSSIATIAVSSSSVLHSPSRAAASQVGEDELVGDDSPDSAAASPLQFQGK